MSMFCGRHGIPVSTRCAQCDADDARAVIEQLQRASDLLSEVAVCGISRTAEGKYHEVQIPLELWDAIQEAVRCEHDKQKK